MFHGSFSFAINWRPPHHAKRELHSQYNAVAEAVYLNSIYRQGRVLPMKRLLALILSTLCLTVLTLCQSEKTSWKEYVYEADGFALTLPTEAAPHPDAILPETTAYSVNPRGAYWGITLRVMHQNRDCSATLGELKTGASKGKSGTDPLSVRDISVDEYPGVEYRSRVEWTKPPHVSLERYYCVNGAFISLLSHGRASGNSRQKECASWILSACLRKVLENRHRSDRRSLF